MFLEVPLHYLNVIMFTGEGAINVTALIGGVVGVIILLALFSILLGVCIKYCGCCRKEKYPQQEPYYDDIVPTSVQSSVQNQPQSQLTVERQLPMNGSDIYDYPDVREIFATLNEAHNPRENHREIATALNEAYEQRCMATEYDSGGEGHNVGIVTFANEAYEQREVFQMD